MTPMDIISMPVEPPFTIQRAEVIQDYLLRIECIGAEATILGGILKDGVHSGTMPQWGEHGVYYYDDLGYTRWYPYSKLPFETTVPDYLYDLSVHGEDGEFTAIAEYR